MTGVMGFAALVALIVALAAGQTHAQNGASRAAAAPPVTVAAQPGASGAPEGDSTTKPLGARVADLRLDEAVKRYGNTTIGFFTYAPAKGGQVSRLCSQRDFFDDWAANLACRHFGYSGGGYRLSGNASVAQVAAVASAFPNGAITLFQCGNAATNNALENCTYSELLPGPVQGCTDDDLIVLKCYGDGALRLVDSPPGKPYQGRLQMFWDGEWQNVCTQGFDPNTAKTACRLMGYGFNASQPAYAMPAGTYDPLKQRLSEPNVWIPRIACNGGETVLPQCGPQSRPVASIGNTTKCYLAEGGVGLDAAVDCGLPPPSPQAAAPKRDAGTMAGLSATLLLLLVVAAVQVAC